MSFSPGYSRGHSCEKPKPPVLISRWSAAHLSTARSGARRFSGPSDEFRSDRGRFHERKNAAKEAISPRRRESTARQGRCASAGRGAWSLGVFRNRNPLLLIRKRNREQQDAQGDEGEDAIDAIERR